MAFTAIPQALPAPRLSQVASGLERRHRSLAFQSGGQSNVRPRVLPALRLVRRLVHRAARAGVDAMNYWPVVAVIAAWFAFLGYARLLLGPAQSDEED